MLLFTYIYFRCNGSCNTLDDPFGGICVPNKRENASVNAFNMIKTINESKTSTKDV